MSSTQRPRPSNVRLLAPVVAVTLAGLAGCGGDVGSDSDGDGLDTADGGEIGSGGAPSSGGAQGMAGGAPSSGGAQGAAGGAASAPEGGVPVCAIRESGTSLTEGDCHTCILPGAQCETNGTIQFQLTPEFCVNALRASGGHCEWYADGAPFDAPWGVGVVTICDSNPGRVACGGGL